jgi:hypothetical protein
MSIGPTTLDLGSTYPRLAWSTTLSIMSYNWVRHFGVEMLVFEVTHEIF